MSNNYYYSLRPEHFTVQSGGGVSVNGVDRVKKGGVVAIVADWCGHCNRFKPELNKLAQSRRSDGLLYTIEEKDLSKDPDLMKSLNVKGYPTLKIMDRSGNLSDYTGSRDISVLNNLF